jgi:hypothetical protein
LEVAKIQKLQKLDVFEDLLKHKKDIYGTKMEFLEEKQDTNLIDLETHVVKAAAQIIKSAPGGQTDGIVGVPDREYIRKIMAKDRAFDDITLSLDQYINNNVGKSVTDKMSQEIKVKVLEEAQRQVEEVNEEELRRIEEADRAARERKNHLNRKATLAKNILNQI